MRHSLQTQLAALPDEAFTRLQYLQPQVGCFNRCAFCSQEAGTRIWQFTRRSLSNFIAALGAEASRRGVRVGTDRGNHRHGTIFPYLDNDIASYSQLGFLIEQGAKELGASFRLSTVGYSRHNEQLRNMHRQIALNFGMHVAGIRFSITPYTKGYVKNRESYAKDLAANLQDWLPYIESRGPSASTAAVELRFPPLIGIPLDKGIDEFIANHHVVRSGPHLLVSIEPKAARPDIASIVNIQGRSPTFSVAAENYYHIISDHLPSGSQIDDLFAAKAAILQGSLPGHVEPSLVYRWLNQDGHYYAINSDFDPSGMLSDTRIYPKLHTRENGGYLDATRFFLNALIIHKRQIGKGKREVTSSATQDDIQRVIELLKLRARELGAFYADASVYISKHVIPLVAFYASVLHQANLPADYFFHPRFTIDTGPIVNQGRALSLFQGLSSIVDEPISPRDERGYGSISESSQRGRVWRIAPVPFDQSSRSQRGGKNNTTGEGCAIIEEMDTQHLRPSDRQSLSPLRRYILYGIEVEQINASDSSSTYLTPGA